MQGVDDELRALLRMRRALAGELVFCAAAALGLFVASGRLAGAGADVQLVFVLCLAAFGSSTAHMLPRIAETALFRCPRCSQLFHAAAGVLRLRACAHCRLPARSGPPPASAD